MGDIREQGTPKQRNDPSPGTPVNVTVYASRRPDGSFEFSHDWSFQGGNSQGGGDIVIPRKKKDQPGTRIHFHLRDKTDTLSFACPESEAIWVNRDSCPQEAATDPEITIVNRTPRLLTINDSNEDDCDLHYNLRFDPDPDRYFYDPTIRNGGSI